MKTRFYFQEFNATKHKQLYRFVLVLFWGHATPSSPRSVSCDLAILCALG
jgi:hypothetical protein